MHRQNKAALTCVQHHHETFPEACRELNLSLSEKCTVTDECKEEDCHRPKDNQSQTETEKLDISKNLQQLQKENLFLRAEILDLKSQLTDVAVHKMINEDLQQKLHFLQHHKDAELISKRPTSLR